MVRPLYARLKISGDLVAQSPIHVGGHGGDPLIDLPLAVDGQGGYYIPGTSMAGCLRQWMRDFSGVDQLWGFQQNDLGQASAILVSDAPIKKVMAEVRDGVGIDRYTGAAAEHVKFQRAILPKGTRIPLELVLEQNQPDTKDWDCAKAKVAALLQALEAGEVSLGAAKTRGLGLVKLENLKILEQHLNQREGMLAALQGQGTGVSRASLENQSLGNHPSTYLMIEIHWQPQGPVMVKAEADGIAVDSLPLTSADGDLLTFVLPGSSIKGALRSQAERIVRTVKGRSVPNVEDSKQRFSQQIEEEVLINRMFGVSAKRQDADTKLGMGALAVSDCYAQNLRFCACQWQNVTTAGNERRLGEALEDASLSGTQQAFHVAIDRWTGGAADGFLYSTLEPFGIGWEPLRLRLDISRLSKQELNLSVALLLLLLRDLGSGRIPLGYATNRGMGSIQVTSLTMSIAATSSLAFLNHKAITGDVFSQLPCPELEEILATWLQWINQPEEANV
jgi:CRISPR/Cas system CSM-associated protein Csm3 (group 7 of RAMP superfamily)